MARKYTLEEIERMRDSLSRLYPYGVSYRAGERAAEVEDRLRTHMSNGTEPSELEAAASEYVRGQIEAQERQQKYYAEQRKNAPPQRVLATKEDVIDEWFQTCVAKYKGASVTAKELYDGFGGRTLMSFANQNAPDGIHIKQSDMERYLDKKGVRSRSAMFAKRYDGIRHVIHGNVRCGNYGT